MSHQMMNIYIIELFLSRAFLFHAMINTKAYTLSKYRL